MSLKRLAAGAVILCLLPIGLAVLWIVLKLDEREGSEGPQRARRAGL